MKLIVACDPKGGIGYKNKLPWGKIQGDLPRFRQLTEHKAVIMGRNTWESLPIKPLPNRLNFVVTTDPMSLPWQINQDRIYAIRDLNALNSFNSDACVIGGAKLIDTVWPLISSVHLTQTVKEYTCDCFIDLLYLQTNFVQTHSENFSDHSYTIWKRQ